MFIDQTVYATITLKNLAPWIMLLIALWGIARLFRKSEGQQTSSEQEPSGWDDEFEAEDTAEVENAEDFEGDDEA